ncbi:c-type cytochrome [Hydrogenophaga sp. PBL-H3]|uniref:c-type cytochrome n=1 Tax=Hydrogenophaga sp. PBL-H3 TaxID=434010 RepID=UPI00131FE91D|nr:c-type cytochrome [Hydrogenophaga sp. PBL-H3]QHE76908.1 class I cytochrome c [Hydrogenophaga sp. PBL-H3]QHE81332.1 class I cytochrome c [Hydrogenophaga sp. PBL-H3]
MTRTLGMTALWLLCGAVQAQTNTTDFQARAWAASCAACHGTDGKSNSAIPAIAGQDKAVLLQKLLAYKQGTLPATVMHQHAKGYTEAELERLAAHFSRQPK